MSFELSVTDVDTCDHMVNMINAVRDGKTVEVRRWTDSDWEPLTVVEFDFVRNVYRLRPSPRSIWMVESTRTGSVIGTYTDCALAHTKCVAHTAEGTNARVVKFIEEQL